MSSQLHLVHDGDMGTEGVEAGGDILVAAVDGVDVAQDAGAVGGEHPDEQQAGRAQGRGADDVGFGIHRRALDVNAVRVGQFDVHAHFGHLRGVDGAVFKHPVVDEGAAFSRAGNRHEVGDTIRVDAWPEIGMDLIDWRFEVAVVLFDCYVGQVDNPIVGFIGFRHREGQTHDF